MNTQGGCAWTATSATSWVTLRTDSGAGAGSVQIDVGANAAQTARTGTATIAGHTFTVQQAAAEAPPPPPPPPPCTYAISPTNVSAAATGGAFTATVNTQGGCAWTATSATSWVTLRTDSGVGAGSVQIDVGANAAQTARTGTATIAGRTFTVQQAAAEPPPPPPPPPCTYAISPTNVTAAAAGGAFTATVNTQGGCAWTAASDASWVSVEPDGGTGPSTVRMAVRANANAMSRTGTVSIAGKTLRVDQEAVACTFRITPSEARISEDEQSLSVSVMAPDGCAWSVDPREGWIDVTRGSSGTGDGVVRLSVGENRSRNERIGRVTIAGEVFHVIQSGRDRDRDVVGALMPRLHFRDDDLDHARPEIAMLAGAPHFSGFSVTGGVPAKPPWFRVTHTPASRPDTLLIQFDRHFLAGVVKLADAPDSKSGGLNARVGSIPSSGTNPDYRQLQKNVREDSGRVSPGFPHPVPPVVS